MSTFVEAESALNHRLCECGLVPGESEAIGIIASPCLNYQTPEKMHQAVGAKGTQRLFKQNEKNALKPSENDNFADAQTKVETS